MKICVLYVCIYFNYKQNIFNITFVTDSIIGDEEPTLLDDVVAAIVDFFQVLIRYDIF